MKTPSELGLKIGYEFKDESLLAMAITHRSFSAVNNERIEFLGDSLLNMIIAEALYKRFPDMREGELSRVRALLVSGKTLAELATEFDLGAFLRLGAGEKNTGGHRRNSTLADAVEALIGGIYIESGFDVCRERVLAWFDSRLVTLNPDSSHKDAKTRLQEFLQARKLPLPDYQLINTEGADHQQTFVVSCAVPLLKSAVSARGSSRRKAEQAAAEKVLLALKDSE
ncbi:Ribonuclease 3 [Zhongshania aliphaticivorans]|uniref:Ribonuclease 3 n=1 Tax=Zhongshania aliphaticivorans TaxID=1470434 RepID=A0A5S9Q9A4_9GAMM|nr:ribonuclease III [Zhongshania aliphaticivorans]CAA0087350.1 Ribonuclease 3 [Zhongshania aliphaticivorans]CAA0114614.1 Ribonuclease 3 [Zhongshania aliphaticivorans]